MKTTLAMLFVLAAAAHARADEPHSTVIHVPPISAEAGRPIELEAMIDAPFAEKLAVRWRPLGETAWHDVAFERSSAGGWFVALPAADARGVEYYIAGTDAAGANVDHFASAAAPHVVRIDPRLDDRLEDLDLARIHGHRNEVAFDVTGHDFGNRYGIRDQFIRSEAVFSYKLLRELHEIAFGFGSITGFTPDGEGPMSERLLKGTRYGFGQVRLRAYPSVFVDARLGLGVSQGGFEANGRGVVTLGKPWRSCVQLGAEMLGGVGPSAWVRLQWDTAAPVLMGASVVRTDLPGAENNVDGLYIAYDAQYQLAARFTVRGQVSFGARDGAAHLGGGLGTAIAF